MRCVPGVETWDGEWYRRVLDLPAHPAVASLRRAPGGVECVIEGASRADVEGAFAACADLCDASADPVAIDAALSADRVLAPLVAARPGLRSPGHVEAHELCVRALLGQQITVVAARTIAARLVAAVDAQVCTGHAGLTHRFPRPDELLRLEQRLIPGPEARNQALRTLCRALADGTVRFRDQHGQREAGDRVVRDLLALRGIGPWTAGYIAMRALADRDVFLPTDIGVRHGLALIGVDATSIIERSARWRPWRSYVVHHLWAAL